VGSGQANLQREDEMALQLRKHLKQRNEINNTRARTVQERRRSFLRQKRRRQVLLGIGIDSLGNHSKAAFESIPQERWRI
jgi:hypothetical protein